MPRGATAGITAFIAVLTAVFLVSHYLRSTVPEGHVGIVVNMGRAEDRLLGPGPNMVWPFVSEIKTLDIRPRTYEFKDSAAGSREQQPLKVTGVVIYRWDRADALRLYREVGWDYDRRALPSVVEEQLKNVIAGFQAYDAEEKTGMNARRAEITEGTLARLQRHPELARNGLLVDSVAIANFDFDDEYEKAIVRAQVEEQNDRAEEVRTNVVTQQANQVAAKADGERRASIAAAEAVAQKARLDSDAKTYAIRQEGEAIKAANEAVRSSLSPELIEYERVQKWNGTVPQVQMGQNGATPLLNISPQAAR